MSLSILDNISSLAAENQLNMTQASLQNTLQELSSGSRLNNGADDPAGLAIANGLEANITALTQSGQNATDGLGVLQVADGALSQVTSLLNQAVTIATEASNGTVTTQQSAALDAEFTSIKNEITRIGGDTTYNGSKVFSGTASNVYLTDGTTAGSSTIAITVGTLSSSSIGFSTGLTAVNLASDSLTSASNAQTALGDINNAISNVAADRGTLGADENRLQSASNVITAQVTNLTSAESSISSADMGQTVSQMSQESILEQTGIAALQQSNQMQQAVLKLLQ